MMKFRNARSWKMKQSQMWKVLLAGVLMTSVACVDGAESIQILRNQLPTDGCVVPTSADGEYQSFGRIDIASQVGYLFTPLIQSNAEAVDETTRLVFMKGANVDISFPSGGGEGTADDLLHFRQPFSGSLSAGGVLTPSFDIVPKQTLDTLTVNAGGFLQLSVDVAAVGDLDGSEVTSNTFTYPVEVCSGCLTNVLGDCDGLDLSGVTVRTGGVCNVLQDGIMDCCSAPDGSLTCPAVAIVPEV
jgi:hypothetical protein